MEKMRFRRTKQELQDEREVLTALYNWGQRHNKPALTKKGRKFIGVE